ncbi:hypothetical protein [Flavobacterium sp. F52]|uniref:hypothetical protein n=1 Tax=Flavobacterium sp. F52 TaxID=1202532 RepID=UPI000272DF77|nr:hypothetical protein [Flavobacterium sp. F52]EJG03400.1 hypothetical protein FF52_00585 [Flavobacterium sp. F52]
MIKGNPIHDTIVIVKRDTIVKIVELVNKTPEQKKSDFIQWFNDYSNVSTFFGTIATVGALIVAIIAIFKTAKDSRQQLLVGKIEEIYELIVYLVVDYDKLYKLELKLQKCGDKTDENYIQNIEKYNLDLEEVNKKVDLNDLFNKVIRLHVLANSYLDKDLNLEVISYCRLFECLIATVKRGNSNRKKTEYPEGFPTTENLRNLVSYLANKLIIRINLGGEKKGNHNEYLYYRDNVFKRKLKLK